MLLVLRRVATARTLLAAAAITATLTTALLVAFLQFAALLPAAGARATLSRAAPVEKVLLASGASGSTAAEVGKRDAAVRRLAAQALGGVPTTVHAAGYASGQRLPDDFGGVVPDANGSYAVVAFLDALPEHADLVAGRWPAVAPADRPAEVVLPERVARQLGVAVGDLVPISDDHARRPKPVEVVGIFRPRDPAEPYWQLAAAPVAAGGYGPMVVHRDEFLTRYVSLSTLDWVVTPRLVGVSNQQLARIGDQSAYLMAASAETLGLDPSIRISSGLPELSARLGTATVVTRSGLLLPALLFLVVAGYALVLVARLLAEQRRAENALLLARGAARRQLARFAAVEALLVVVPATLLGAPLAAWALREVDRRSVRNGLDLLDGAAPLGRLTPIGPIGTRTAWVIAVVAALGCAAALVLPAVRQRGTWVDVQQARSRPPRLVGVLRHGVDVALVAVAGIAAVQLRRYAGPLTPTVAGPDLDPLLVAAPTVGVLAATVATLRLLPLVTRGAVRLAGRRGSFARLLGLWQADRRPHAGPVFLLVLAVAAGTLAMCVAATWQRSQRDQASHRVGADVRVTLAGTGTGGTGTGAGGTAVAAELAALPGVRRVMAVDRSTVTAGDTSGSLLALDAAAAGDVVRLRADLADAAPARLFARLAEARRSTPGLPLPPGARRLIGEVDFTAAFPGRDVSSDQLVAFVDDGTGVVHRLPLGVPQRGPFAFDVPLPVTTGAGTAKLVGLGGAASANEVYRFDPQTTRGTAEWTWRLLATADQSGARTQLAVPAQWVALRQGDDGPEPERLAGLLGARFAAAAPNGSFSWQYLLAPAAPEAAPVPALVTPQMLAASGASVGSVIILDSGGRDLEVTVAGTITALPGTDDGTGAVLDLPTLSAYLFGTGQLSGTGQEDGVPDEWWLAAQPGGQAEAGAAAAGRGFAVLERTAETARLLGDPLGAGVLGALYAAVLAGTALAAFGLIVDARATALRRSGELAVLHTLGTPPTSLARALVVEQAVLAGLGVLGGTAVGLAVAGLMASSLVPTSAGARPVPDPLVTVPVPMTALPAVVLFAAALLLGALVALRARRDLVGELLRIGEDR